MTEKEAAQRLKRILDRRSGIIPDAARFDGLLRDYFPGERGDAEILLAALREGIPGRLPRDIETPRAVLRTNLEELLRRRRRTDAKAAAWAVAVWAAALDIELGPRLAQQDPISSIEQERRQQGPPIGDEHRRQAQQQHGNETVRHSRHKTLFAAAAVAVGVIAFVLTILIAAAQPPPNWADLSKTVGDLRIHYALGGGWEVEGENISWWISCRADSDHFNFGIKRNNSTYFQAGDTSETSMRFYFFRADVNFGKAGAHAQADGEEPVKITVDIDSGKYMADFVGSGWDKLVTVYGISSGNPIFEAMREASNMVVTASAASRPHFTVPLAASFSFIDPRTWSALLFWRSPTSAAYQAWQEARRCATANGMKF